MLCILAYGAVGRASAFRVLHAVNPRPDHEAAPQLEQCTRCFW